MERGAIGSHYFSLVTKSSPLLWTAIPCPATTFPRLPPGRKGELAKSLSWGGATRMSGAELSPSSIPGRLTPTRDLQNSMAGFGHAREASFILS